MASGLLQLLENLLQHHSFYTVIAVPVGLYKSWLETYSQDILIGHVHYLKSDFKWFPLNILHLTNC